ncbi:MAG: hypothetical protein K9G69_05895, partial [Candidatus Nanopelagicales bacterium]|nr:hypothetical protein [Candidatus Nanopelagicales bacterium]
RLFRDDLSVTNQQLLIGGAILIAVLLVGSWLLQLRADKKQARIDAAAQARITTPFEPMAGGHPVPPLPGQTFEFTPRRVLAASAAQKPAAITPDQSAEQESDHA